MTYSKLFGVYFNETVGTTGTPSVQRTFHPCFIVQTSSTMSSIDDVLTKFESFAAFETIATGKGLTNTLTWVEEVLNDYQSETFYVYSIKTDTSAGFSNFVKGVIKEDIRDFIYIEETKSANANTFASKIGAFVTGLNDNYTNGLFRTCTIIPYGTVADAVTNKTSGTRDETAAITAMTTALTGVTSGRIIMVCPDTAYCGKAAGRLISTPYDESAGKTALDITATFDYDFTKDEMLTLQNAGIVFVKSEVIQGVEQYRIHEGLTASFASSAADGFLKARRTVDELLRQVRDVCTADVKDEDMELSKAHLQTECDNIVDSFITDGGILKTATVGGVKYTSGLNVTVVDREEISISGTLIPSGAVDVINVNTTIQ